jgi:hypothetical protein
MYNYLEQPVAPPPQSLTGVKGVRAMCRVGELRHRWQAFGVFVLVGALLAGCKTVDGGPDRLYSVSEEVAQARGLLDVAAPGGVPGLIERYYAVVSTTNTAADDAQRMFLRNEIIARRMYIIDVEYSEYEASLTSERQKFGFLTTAAASALGIAATLTTPLRSAQIVSGAGAAVLASRGAYDSEVVIAKTLQIVQGYMRAARDNVAARQILPRVSESTITYPLSAALHDLEDYYRAGTFTAGLIPALQESGAAAKNAANEKANFVAFGPDQSTNLLRAYLTPGGKLNLSRVRSVNACLRAFQLPVNILDHLTRSDSAAIRMRALQCARADPQFSMM